LCHGCVTRLVEGGFDDADAVALDLVVGVVVEQKVSKPVEPPTPVSLPLSAPPALRATSP
jgi:hypothetical protein